MESPKVPDNMRPVSEKEFFALLYADPRDIMPNHDNPDFTAWQTQRTHEVWGWSAPGWKNPGAHPKIWAVTAGGAK